MVANLMAEILESIDSNSTSDVLFEVLKNVDKIERINEIVSCSDFFLVKKKDVIAFYDEIDSQNITLGKKIEHAWLHLLERLVSSPTKLFSEGVIVLCLPVVWMFLERFFAEKNGKLNTIC